jgi:hypothetical protein
MPEKEKAVRMDEDLVCDVEKMRQEGKLN